MRILHLVPGLMTGGQETMLINIANEQVKEHEVIVMIVNKDYDDNLIRLFDKRVKVVCIDRPRSSKNPWYFLKLNLMIWKLHPYVVHSHYEKLVMYLIRIGYKFVYTIHGFTIPPKYLRRNCNLVAISKGIQADVKERAGIDSTVIYNGLKVENIKPKGEVSVYNGEKLFRIVQVSRLFHEVKGQDVLINAIALLRDKGYTNISVDFIGEGDSKDYLENLAKELNLGNVSFLGTKPVEYISEHLCDYDLFVQPSRYEGFGLTVAEAMTAGVSVVVSDCPGLMEVVGDGRYSLVFDNGNVENCAAKIETVIKGDRETIQKKVNDASKFVREKFNVKKTALNYVNFYKECE